MDRGVRKSSPLVFWQGARHVLLHGRARPELQDRGPVRRAHRGNDLIMITNLLTKIFGSRNERLLKQYSSVVRQINALEAPVSALSDDELRARTVALKERVGNGEELDAVIPEAFAVVREASKRTLQMRHFDVQLLGGMVLHNGKIAEMKTGEGKTLVATLPAYLNALAGQGV